MSTPNPSAHEPKRGPIVPTEAHEELARRVYNALEHLTEENAAQLIAESEARALAAHDATYQRACEVEHELRAEIEAFKSNNRYHRGHSAGYAEAKDDCEAELLRMANRAEKAEASVRVLRDGLIDARSHLATLGALELVDSVLAATEDKP